MGKGKYHRETCNCNLCLQSSGKGWEEIYGKEKASQMKEKLSRERKGKAISPNSGYKKGHPCYYIRKKGEYIPSEETRRKMSKLMMGKFKDVKRPGAEKNLGKYAIKGETLGEKNPFYGKTHSPEAIKKIFEGRNYDNRPTSIEKEMIGIIEKYTLPFRYVGDGSFWIGRKNPDFISIDKKKIIIETYEPYWHSENYEKERSEEFLRYGWKTIFFKNGEINDKNVLEKLR